MHSHERNYIAYLEIDRLIPGLASKIAKLDADEKADYFTLVRDASTQSLVLINKQLQKGANDARSDDFRRVSALVGAWINEDRDKPELDAFNYLPYIRAIDERTGESREVKQYPPPLTKSRNIRGVEHDFTGALLTSIATKWNDQECVICRCLLICLTLSFASTRAKVRGGTVHLGGNYFLRIFYHDFQGDPKNVQEGFCRSRYLVKVCG